MRPLKNVHFFSSSRTAKILTTGAPQEMPLGWILVIFRGLKFETDPREIGCIFHGAGAEIGQKRGVL
jgi:hypothetical protein